MNDPLIPPELLTPGLLLTDPRLGTGHPFYLALGLLFGVLLLGGIVAYALAPRLLHHHRLRVRLFRRLVTAIASLSGLGLFWVVCRVIGMPLFARPLWLWFTLLAYVGLIAYAIYYWRRRYPAKVSAYEEIVRRRRWMPTPRKRAAARRR